MIYFHSFAGCAQILSLPRLYLDYFIMNRKFLLFTLTLFLAFLPLFAGNVRHVNMFLGSEYDHGQMTPAAAVPFGMIAVCPDSDPAVDVHGGYNYAEPRISGISINRVSGVGCNGVGGNLSIRPALPDEEISIVKPSEKAVPGYYGTDLSNGVHLDLTASRSVAFEKYTFPKGTQARLFVNFLSSIEKKKVSCSYHIADERTIRGRVSAGTTCAKGVYTFYFALQTSTPFSVADSTSTTALLLFDEDKVEVRIGVSASCEDSAAKELELAKGSFSHFRKAAYRQWEEKLSKIDVKGGDEEQKALFYTSMYRIYLSPMDASTAEGTFVATDGKEYPLAKGHKYYSSWSMWDTFRTKFPMLVILEGDKFEDIAASAAEQFVTGKKNWATPHECVPTVRTEHTGLMLLDAYRKGVPVDFSRAYEGIVKEARSELPRKSPDNLIETSIDIWALSQIAGIVGKQADSAKYASEAIDMFETVWKDKFMDITPEFGKMKASGLYQGNLWQYRWGAPQFLDTMISLKGKTVLADELETFFERGYFNQGNEPDIHTPWLFNAFGKPELAQRWVMRYMIDDAMVHIYGGNAEYLEPYVGRAFRNTVDGLAPEMDEDDGAMGAWYMFAQMGFYPLVVGKPEYEISSPLFDKVTIRNGSSRVTIQTKGRKGAYDSIKRITLDGKELSGYTLPHEVFLKGGTVVLWY